MILEEMLQLVQIVLAVGLTILILLQAANAGGIGSLFGGSSSAIQKTRRGLEKTLFQLTIGFAAAFIGNAILQLLIA